MRQKGIDLGKVKEAQLEPKSKDGDTWLLINSISCRPIKKLNGHLLPMHANPENLWFSLLNLRKDL